MGNVHISHFSRADETSNLSTDLKKSIEMTPVKKDIITENFTYF